MPKKKSNNAAAKAAKKVKAAQKIERKETKKVKKSKNKYHSEDEEEQDLEAILEAVYSHLFYICARILTDVVHRSRCEKNGKTPTQSLKNW